VALVTAHIIGAAERGDNSAEFSGQNFGNRWIEQLLERKMEE
jgi:hypothetical protein